MSQYTDTEILDWLEAQNNKNVFTGMCLFRWSNTGRGWRLHETSVQNMHHEFVKDSVRAAIMYRMDEDKDSE